MEPELPKLPKNKIKPNIQPDNINRSVGKNNIGNKVNPLVRNITGSDNLFSKLQERNPEVRNKRGTRTLFNMLGTFGTERNEKIIRYNLQLLRNTLVETFEIAKLLRMNAAGATTGAGSAVDPFSGMMLAGIGLYGGYKIGTSGEVEDEGASKEQVDAENEVKKLEEEIETFEKESNSTEVKELEDTVKDDNNILSGLKDTYDSMSDAIGKQFSKLKEAFKNFNIEEQNKEINSEEEGANELDNITNSMNQLVNNLNLTNKQQETGSDLDMTSIMKELRNLESNNDYSAMSQRNIEGFNRQDEDITGMTIDQVDQLQTDYLNFQKDKGVSDDKLSAAMGAYQMMDIKKIAESMGMDTSKTLFNKETQDAMMQYYFDLAGLKDYEEGTITAEQFNNNLAKLFATIQKTDGKGVYDDDGFHNAKGDILDLIKGLKPEIKSNEQNNSLFNYTKDDIIPFSFSEPIIIGGDSNLVNAISSGKKTVMFNNDSGRGVNSGPTLAFRSSTDPDGSNIFGKSILGVTD